MDRTYLSEKGYEKLQEELKELVEKKQEIVKRVKVAAAHGDLKENFEYTSAKEALALVMERIDSAKRRLITADIIKEEDIESDRVILGSTVYMEDTDTGEKSKLSLVVEDKIDPLNDMISVNSPIARGFIGKKVGEEVTIEIPAGTKHYKITRIERNL